jgi:hypothetical protein
MHHKFQFENEMGSPFCSPKTKTKRAVGAYLSSNNGEVYLNDTKNIILILLLSNHFYYYY